MASPTGGEVALFDRNDGSFAVPVFQLPFGDPPPAAPPRPALWVAGLMDPSIISPGRGHFLRRGSFRSRTPRPSIPKTGRIYITAAGPALEDGSYTGLLYGLDIVGGEVQIAFAASDGRWQRHEPGDLARRHAGLCRGQQRGDERLRRGHGSGHLAGHRRAAGSASPGVGP